MGVFQDAEIRFYCSDEDVDVSLLKHVRVSRDSRNLYSTWELTFATPIAYNSDTTFTVEFWVQGQKRVLFEEAKATSISGERSEKSWGTTVRGEWKKQNALESEDVATPLKDLLDYCVPKTLIFISPTWKQARFPDATIRNGVLVFDGQVYSGPDGMIKVPPKRVKHSRLPGDEFQEGTFQCICSPTTHHAVAKYLAQLIGFQIVVNTPDIEILDTFTIPAGTTWFDAITRNFSIWGAQIEIVRDTIYVSDIFPQEDQEGTSTGYSVLPSSNVLAGSFLQSLEIDYRAIKSISLEQGSSRDLASVWSGGSGNNKIIDHLIITGRKSWRTAYDDPIGYQPVLLAATPMSVDIVINTSGSFDNIDGAKPKSDYFGDFESGDDKYTVSHGNTVSQVIGYHKDFDGEKTQYVPVSETTRMTNDSDEIIHELNVSHTYAAGNRIIRTIERESILTNLPGSTEKQLREVRVKITDQSRYIEKLRTAMTVEIVQDLTCYYEDRDQNGDLFKSTPKPLLDLKRADTSRRSIDKKSDTLQKSMWMTTHYRKTFISRTTKGVLLKRDVDYDVLSGTAKMQSQILDNPIDDDSNAKNIFRAEFFDGPGKIIGGYPNCYHPPTTVNHDDICSDVIANAIAARILARRGLIEYPSWEEGSVYSEHAVVRHIGEIYTAILEHTASTTNEPGEGSGWASYWERGLNEWSGEGTQYEEDAFVVRDGVTYTCIQAHAASEDTEPGEGTSWSQYWKVAINTYDTITIKTPVPIPWTSASASVKLASCDIQIETKDGMIEQTIDGGVYALKSVDEDISCDNRNGVNVINYEQIITMRTR